MRKKHRKIYLHCIPVEALDSQGKGEANCHQIPGRVRPPSPFYPRYNTIKNWERSKGEKMSEAMSKKYMQVRKRGRGKENESERKMAMATEVTTGHAIERTKG